MPDTAAFLHLARRRTDFLGAGEISISRTPGRLDVMGGIADYSGALVLQWPLAQATHVAISLRSDKRLCLLSLVAGDEWHYEMSLDDFSSDNSQSLAYSTARDNFRRNGADHWAAYVAGAWLVLAHERGIKFERGANVFVTSDVPAGSGVSSSASLEVATLQALADAYQLTLTLPEIALLAQKVENLIAGAPCGIMDQMAVACGVAGRFLKLRCQPAELLGTVQLPEELGIWGLDSGVRHAVTGADYGTVRTAAFMGYRIIADAAGLACETIGPGRVRVPDSRWRGYLANVTPAEFAAHYAALLPDRMSGADFLQTYEGITDSVTAVNPEQSYPVAAATQHPIAEQARVSEFAALLENWRGPSQEQAARLGALMYASHESYTACGLGSSGTDKLVALVHAAGPAQGLYGAKITGGGSGGTVAVLGRRDAAPTIEKIAARYAQITERRPLIMAGSSAGATACQLLA